MTDTKRVEINKILLIFFPNELNNIIFGYFNQIEHDVCLIRTVKKSSRHNTYHLINNDKIYTYDGYNDTLTSTPLSELDKMVPMHDQIMCMYQDNIYIFDNDSYIRVFDKDFKKIDTFAMPNLAHISYYPGPMMVVVANKIFISRRYGTIILIMDLKGIYIGEIEIQDNDYFECIMTDNDYLYSQTRHNIIYKYSVDGDLIETYKYSLNGDAIDEFTVVDNIIYYNMRKKKRYICYNENGYRSHTTFIQKSKDMKITEITFYGKFIIAYDEQNVNIFSFIKKNY